MEERESFCLFCSLGCKFSFKVDKGTASGPEFCAEYPINGGRLCPRGLYATELLNHPRRLIVPRVGEDGKFKEVPWDQSLQLLALEIGEVKSKYGSQAIGIVIDPNHSNEELVAAQELAKVIGTNNLACSFPPNDWGLLSALDIVSPARVEDIENANCTLVIGNLFVTHPVLARRVIDAKYKARGNTLMVIDPERTNTAWFANTHLQNRPGTEVLTLVGMLKSVLASSPELGKGIRDKLLAIPDEAISKATGLSMSQIGAVGRAFNDAEKGVVLLAPGFRGVADIKLAAQLCKLLVENTKGGKKFIPLFAYGNSVGASSMCSGESWKSLPQLIEEASSGKVKLLIDFGEDLLCSYPSAKLRGALRQLEFLAVSSPLPSETEKLAHMALPCASWLEKSGTVNFFDGRRERLEPVLQPPGIAKSDLEIILRLSRKLGTALDARKVSQEAEARAGKSLGGGKEKPEMGKLVEKVNERITENLAEDREYSHLLVAGESTVHFGDGSITRNMSWAMREYPYPFIRVSVEDAREKGITDGAEVLVSSRAGEIALPVQVTDRLRPRVASVPSYFAETRSIFEWKATSEGELETSPERVSLRAKAPSGTGEQLSGTKGKR